MNPVFFGKMKRKRKRGIVNMRQREKYFVRGGRRPGADRGMRPGGCNTWGTFADCCDSWLEVKTLGVKTSSLIKYERDMENHIKPFFGERLPGDITPEDIKRFTQALLYERELSSGTVRGILVTLHSVLSYIERRTEFRLQKPEVIYPKDERKMVRVLDKKEEAQLVNFLIDKMDLCRLGVYMAIRTGIRIGELCALRWRDISFETCTIFIRHTVQRMKNMDSAAGMKARLALGTPKSDSSDRAIPLMPDLEVLCHAFYPEEPDAFVLTGTGQCMDPRKLQRRLKKYADACGLEGIHFHTLRHTFATRCVESGFDMKTLSEVLGHSDIGITMNRYVHPDMEVKRANMSRLKPVLQFDGAVR